MVLASFKQYTIKLVLKNYLLAEKVTKLFYEQISGSTDELLRGCVELAQHTCCSTTPTQENFLNYPSLLQYIK